MKTLQFLILLGARRKDPAVLANVVQRAQRQEGLRPVFQCATCTVLADPATRATPIGSALGVVLGTVFRRSPDPTGGYEPAEMIPAAHADADALVQHYWGSYLAVVGGEGATGAQLTRDPAGGFGCYLSRSDGLIVLFSDAGMAHRLGLIAGDLDAAPIVHALAFPALPLARTGLTGVEEVQPGTSLTVSPDGDLTRHLAWNPWRFTDRRRQIVDPRAAAAALNQEAHRCVSAWASQAGSILLELSGGLDSSILAACLLDRRITLSLITLTTPDPGADERVYARQVADTLAVLLKCVELDIADARLDPPTTLTPVPGAGLLHQTIDAALMREAKAVGAEAFFSGGGGDNSFCYLSSAGPATDILLSQGPGLAFARAVGDLAGLHGCSAWEAGRLALRKAWRRPRPWRADVDFLHPDAIPISADPHPWLAGADAAAPGKREHVASVLAVQSALIGHQRQSLAPMRFPLLSQPLVEVCLRIPTWLWIAGGRNRAVARDAFVGQLPAQVLQRRTKGDFMGLLGAIYQRHRADLIDLLLGGWLAEQGVIDQPAVEAYLQCTDPVTDLRFYRLMELANAELWARSWLARRRDLGA